MKKLRWLILLVVLLVVIQVIRPVPDIQVQAAVNPTIKVPGQLQTIHWPANGEAVLAVDGVGTIGQNGPNTPVPIASVTKIMTAYLTLKKHPLQEGTDGPTVTVTSDDVAVYNQDKALGESLIQVQTGEQLTERQMLEALLLPSANNIATKLAVWNDGSLDAFVADMNKTAKELGMTNTHYTDASGYEPATVSDAADQVKMAEAAMQDPTFREIVAMPQVDLPLEGLVYNVDYDLGKNGIIGIKTGNTDQAGGCFVFAATDTVGSNPYTIVGAILGEQDVQPLMKALDDALTLVSDAKANLKPVQVLSKTQTVANATAPWNKTGSVGVVPSQNVTFVGWPGMTVNAQVKMDKSIGKTLTAGQQVGTLELNADGQKASVPLKASESVKSPSYTWRILRL